MRRSNLMFLVIGAAIIFSGCSKDDALAPGLDQSDQVTSSLKLASTPFVEFSGESTPVDVPDPGTATVQPNGKTKIRGMVTEWRDVADPDDENVTGQSLWYQNWNIEADGSSAEVWGKADLNLDIGGTWEVSWHGTITANEGYTVNDVGHIKALAYAVGTGKTGDVKGMVAHWTYTMDSEAHGFIWAFTGYYH